MTTLEEALARHHAVLVDLVRREAAGLLRFETPEDLVQGICTRALAGRGNFEYRSEAECIGWLRTVARRHIADRHDYWSALRRGSGRVLRLTWGSSGGSTEASPLPPGSMTGPGTFAERRESLVIAAQALAALPDRDRDLVKWMSEGVPLREQAERLGIAYLAAQRAGLRAVERFRKTFELISRKARS